MASALPPGVEKSSRAGAPRSRKPACLRGAIQVARDACRGTDHLCGASLMAALFEDEQMDTIECESAEAALATLLIGGRGVAMIFADVRLRGVMDGIDLAREVKNHHTAWRAAAGQSGTLCPGISAKASLRRHSS